MAGSKTFGNDLRDARQKAGLTQVKLAAQLGVDPGAVSGWERGIRMPDDQNRGVVAAFMGLSIADYLVKYEATDFTRQGQPASPTGEKAGGQGDEPSRNADELTQEALDRLERVEEVLGRLERVLGGQEPAPSRRAQAARSRK